MLIIIFRMTKRLSLYSSRKCGLVSIFSYHPLEYCFETWNEYDSFQPEITELQLVTKEALVTYLDKYAGDINDRERKIQSDSSTETSIQSIHSCLKDIFDTMDFDQNIKYPTKNLIKSVNDIFNDELFKLRIALNKSIYKQLNETHRYKPMYVYHSQIYGLLIDPLHRSIAHGFTEWNKSHPLVPNTAGIVDKLRRVKRRDLLMFIPEFIISTKFHKPIHVWKSCFGESYTFGNYLKLTDDELLYYILALDNYKLFKQPSLLAFPCFD